MSFVTINSYNNYIEAHIAKGVLEEQNIASWLQDENTVTIDPILTNAVGGIKLLVAKEDAEKAREILNNQRETQKRARPCPRCASTNVELVTTPRKAANWISAFTTFILGNFAIAPDKVHHCFDCELEFAEEKAE